MNAPVYFNGQITYPAGADRPVPSLARYVMQRIEATYADAGKSLPPARVITVGSVAVDSEVLAVMFGQVYTGTPGNEMSTPFRGSMPRSATLNVELWRNAPSISDTGVDPSVAAQSAAAEEIMDDAWLMLQAAYSADQMGVGIIASVAVMEPRGELQGLSMSLEIQVV